MSEFINTIDVLGDDAVVDGIIQRTITEFKDDQITEVGEYAFSGCVALTTVAVPSAKTVAGEAFRGCQSLVYADVSGADTVAGRAFQNCHALEEIHAEQATFIYDWAFLDCTALKKVVLTNVDTFGGNAFSGCRALEYVDSPNALQIWGSVFRDTSLSTLILRKTSKMCNLSKVDAFTNTPIESGTGYIYVPRALIEDYKVATNWSTYADQFRALEDYTVDGTTTGELDETKI